MLTLDELKKQYAYIKEHGHCIFLCPRSPQPEPVPEPGKTYYAYDDGKIRVSREYKVLIKQIYAYDELPDEIKELWQEEVLNAYWLYVPDTDYFVEAEDLEAKLPCWFCRTKDGDWFTFGSKS